MDWTDLFKDRKKWCAVVETVMNLQVPYIVVNFLNSCPRRNLPHLVT